MDNYTIISGPTGSGKTGKALALVAKEIEAGGSVVFLDLDQSLSPARLEQYGIPVSDPQTFALSRPTMAKQVEATMREAIENGVGLIVVDSVGRIPGDPSEMLSRAEEAVRGKDSKFVGVVSTRSVHFSIRST